MPSKDTFHQKRPELNKDLGREPSKSVRPGRLMSGQVQRLAARLGKDPDEIASKIPPDTLRRTKYPVLEQMTPDGKRVFEHDMGIVSGVRSLSPVDVVGLVGRPILLAVVARRPNDAAPVQGSPFYTPKEAR
jgi:hypothetical protein